jgi:hypothetical protein
MKVKLSKVGTVAVLAILVIGIFAVFPAFPSTRSPPKIYVAPSKITFDFDNGTIGTLFNITVRVEDVTDLAAFEVKMYYDDCIINVTRWYEPTTDPDYVFYGKSTLAVPSPPEVDYRHVDPCNGSAHVGVVLFPPPAPGEGFTGSGLLCIFEFNITAVPPEGETYSCTLNINNEDTYLLDSVGEDIPATKENGYYEFSREALPKPTMVFFNINPNPATVGDTITLKGILVDEFSQPLADETVKLYARPLAGSWRYITSLTTSEYGVFMWSATIPVTGTFIFAVYYPGSETYESTYNLAILIVKLPS